MKRFVFPALAFFCFVSFTGCSVTSGSMFASGSRIHIVNTHEQVQNAFRVLKLEMTQKEAFDVYHDAILRCCAVTSVFTTEEGCSVYAWQWTDDWNGKDNAAITKFFMVFYENKLSNAGYTYYLNDSPLPGDYAAMGTTRLCGGVRISSAP